MADPQHVAGWLADRVAVFAADTTIRSLMDPLGKIERWSEYGRGGHFAAMEVPDLLTSEIRVFCRSLR